MHTAILNIHIAGASGKGEVGRFGLRIFKHLSLRHPAVSTSHLMLSLLTTAGSVLLLAGFLPLQNWANAQKIQDGNESVGMCAC